LNSLLACWVSLRLGTMDISVRIPEAAELPEGTHVAVRIGDVVKQGRYEASRIYHFAGAEQRRVAKVDVFRLIGSVALPLDSDAADVSKGRIQSLDPSVQDVDIELHVRRNGQSHNEAKTMVDKAHTRSQLKSGFRKQGLAYIKRTGIELNFAQALQKMLHARPEDPIDFLCSFFLDLRARAKASSKMDARMAENYNAPETDLKETPQSPRGLQDHVCNPAACPEGDSSLRSEMPFSPYYKTFVAPQCPRHFWERLHANFHEDTAAKQMSHNLQDERGSNRSPAPSHEHNQQQLEDGTHKWEWIPSVATWKRQRLCGDFPPLISQRVVPGEVLSYGSPPATASSLVGISGAIDDIVFEDAAELPSFLGWNSECNSEAVQNALGEPAEEMSGGQVESLEPGAESDNEFAE